MNFIKYNPETKAIDLSTVYTSRQENSVLIDGYDTSILKPFLQPKEVDDLEKPIFGGEIIPYVMPEHIKHDAEGFYYLSYDIGEQVEIKTYSEYTSIETETLEEYGHDSFTGEKFYILVKLLWIDEASFCQKISGYEKKTIYVLEEDESLKLPKAKAAKLWDLSSSSLDHVAKLVPEYKQMNALFSIYPEETKLQYKALMEGCRNEYYRCKDLVDAAVSIEEVNAITATFPAL